MRWPEAIPLMDTSTVTLARTLLFYWVTRFGVPVHVTSDRGAQFTSQLWTDLSMLLGLSVSTTTAYHPQANGLVERFHHRLKEALKARLCDPDWADQLPWVLLGICATPKEDLKCSSAELVYGVPISVPGDFIASAPTTDDIAAQLHQLRQRVGDLCPVPTSSHGVPHSSAVLGLQDATFVFV